MTSRQASENLPLFLPPLGGRVNGAPFPMVGPAHGAHDPLEVQQFDNGHLIYSIYQGASLSGVCAVGCTRRGSVSGLVCGHLTGVGWLGGRVV